nr:phage tail family protein [Enterococcus sp. 665A]
MPIRVLGGFTRGPMIGEYENKTIDISDMDGTEVISSRIKEGIIEVPFVIQGDLHTAHDEMMRILNVDEPKKLQFSDQMDRYYLAIPQGKPDAEELVQWFEKGSISFLVPSGVAYAEEETIVTNDREVVTETFVIDGVQGTGSIFVKDLGVENEILNLLPTALPKHRNQSYASTSSMRTTITNNMIRFTATSNNDPYYRPVGTNSADVLKPSTSYTLAFKYKVIGEAMLRVRMIFGTSATVSEYFQNEGVGLCTFKTDATGRQYLSFEPVRVKTEGVLNSSQVGDWFELEELQIVEGEYSDLPYRPAPEDVGLVYGKQLNLLDGSSNDWEEFTFSGWDMGGSSTSLSTMGLAVGDKIACRCEIDNSKGTLKAKFKLVFRNDSGAILEVTPSIISPGEVGISQGEYIIPEGTTNIFWAKASKFDGTNQSTIKVRRNKLIKGSLAALGEWTPSQADSGLTPVNGGMVPFNSDQYAALADPLGFVRAETTQVGCGAELRFDFPVIAELEKRHPYLFKQREFTRKVEEYFSMLRSVKLTSSTRGGGLDSNNSINALKYYLLHIRPVGGGTWLLATGAAGLTDFQKKTVTFSGSFPRQLEEGVYTVFASSKKNYNLDRGAVSDGITPAWVEVKDVKLEIELELPRKQTLIINNEGTHKTAPEFSFDFEEDNGYIGVAHQDGIIQYGSPSEVDGVTKQKSVVLLQDRFDNNKGWEINSSKAVTMLPMTANGTVKWDPIQSFVYPTDFGTGDGWHGVTLTQALSQEADNFTLESLSRIQDIWAEKAGRLEFTISAADGTPLFSMQFRDDSVSSSQNQFWAYVGNQEVDRDTSTWRWRWWLGSLTVRKAGNLWEWTIQNGHNKWTRQYLDGGYAVSNKKAARITIAFAAFGDKKPIAWEDVAKNKSGMGWSELRFVKDNVDYWVDLPNKMKAGDTVEIRNTEGKIYKYWQNQEPIQDMLDADIGNNYFLLPVGESEVQFHFSDYMSEPPLITAKYRKTYR